MAGNDHHDISRHGARTYYVSSIYRGHTGHGDDDPVDIRAGHGNDYPGDARTGHVDRSNNHVDLPYSARNNRR